MDSGGCWVWSTHTSLPATFVLRANTHNFGERRKITEPLLAGPWAASRWPARLQHSGGGQLHARGRPAASTRVGSAVCCRHPSKPRRPLGPCTETGRSTETEQLWRQPSSAAGMGSSANVPVCPLVGKSQDPFSASRETESWLSTATVAHESLPSWLSSFLSRTRCSASWGQVLSKLPVPTSLFRALLQETTYKSFR